LKGGFFVSMVVIGSKVVNLQNRLPLLEKLRPYLTREHFQC